MVYLLDLHGLFICAFYDLFVNGILNFFYLQLQENEDLRQKLEKCEAEIEKTRKTDELMLIPFSSFTRYVSSICEQEIFRFRKSLYNHAKTW